MKPSSHTNDATMAERLRIAVRRVTGAPVAAVRVWLRGGARAEEPPGQAYVTGRLLTEGTERRAWDRIAEEAEERGMILSSFGAFEAHGVSLDALATDWEQALEWAAELVLEASFPEDRCDWIRRQTEAELESLGDEPDVRTAWGFLEQLYDPHPAARPLQGNASSLRRLSPEDCRSFHRRALEHGCVIAVAGEIDEAQVRAKAEGLFADLAGRAVTLPRPMQPGGLAERRRTVSIRVRGQAHLYAGHLTVSRYHSDFAALELLAVVLGAGAGLTGRIPARIREREGLAYAAQAATVAGAGMDAGRLEAYLGTSPQTLKEAERGVVEEITRMAEEGVEEAELNEARAYLLGREPFRRETARQWADLLGAARFYDLPIDRPEWFAEQLQALDLEGVNDVAKRHLLPEELRITVGLAKD